MRTALAVAFLLVVLGVVAWLATSGSVEPLARDLVLGPRPPAVPAPQAPSSPVPAPRLTAAPTVPERPVRVSEGVVLDRGDLRVRLVDPEGALLTDDARIDIAAAPGHPVLPAGRLPVREEDGTWLYRDLPSAEYQVRAVVPGRRLGLATARVRREKEAGAEVVLAPGCVVAYRVEIPGEEPPETVAVVVLDARGRVVPAPVEGAPGIRLAPAAGLPPGSFPDRREGRVHGLEPGTYRLRVTSPAGGEAEATFDARPGDVGTVVLRLPR
jgi:hypothetical protein